MKHIFFSILILPMSSCHKEVKSERGAIDIVSNIYFGASKGLDKMESFHVSKLNYSGNQMVEFVPDLSLPEINRKIFYINDTVAYPIEGDSTRVIFSEISKKEKALPVWQKKEGAIFSKEQIQNYKNRRNLSDTVLFKKKYRRFEINSPWNNTRFYVYPTDTILPYSIYRHAETDYGGRIERIDSYNKKDDIFVSLQLLPRKNWDGGAREIFEFNDFVKKRKSE